MAFDHDTGASVSLQIEPGLVSAVDSLGLQHSMGYLQLIRMTRDAASGASGSWLPLQIAQGCPLVPLQLNAEVCRRSEDMLSPARRQNLMAGQQRLASLLEALIAEYGIAEPKHSADDQAVGQPVQNMLLDDFSRTSKRGLQCELTDCLQGVGIMCAGPS